MFRSASQLLVPMFMLFIMVVCFSVLLVELEWNPRIDGCIDRWVKQGISRDFIARHRNGITWDCTGCDSLIDNVTAAANADALLERVQLCTTCGGHPVGHPECLGLRWTQQFPDIPTAMWFCTPFVTPCWVRWRWAISVNTFLIPTRSMPVLTADNCCAMSATW